MLASEVARGDVRAAPAHMRRARTPVTSRRVAAVVVLGELLLVASIDWLIEATGSVNVATEIGVVGPANITAEALIAAAPDVLLVTTDGIASVGGTDALLSMLMTRLAAEEAESTKENP